jgi:hypothetical protein
MNMGTKSITLGRSFTGKLLPSVYRDATLKAKEWNAKPEPVG